ncbi:ABC transporter ATP-binding protein [Oleomonas cavernae]|uniref:ABC transporter ATP-binding protein n=1 Tax=Oleomonas cavernae TaxID=2320859 RepID=A0A418W8Q1_9PROT|nr:ABC transporter ATP-binding protein [Oleomonas cavernae]RJF86314.1 ABC transporter ATP-binding protein [Oleomonas cavernae]
MELLRVEGLNVCYGLSKVLHDVALTVGRGELVSLVGRNGVGKSTTMRGIMGLTPPRAGSILWKGEQILRRSPHRNARAGIGYVPEDRRIFSSLTVWENLDVARLPPRPGQIPWDEDRVFEFFPDLLPFKQREGGLLSGGQQQMLTIGRTLMGNPELLLLDEPSEGVAPIIVAGIEKKIRELKEAGLSIILAEQNLDFVLALSDRCYVLEKGSIVFAGTAQELRANREVQDRYLYI